MQALENVLDNRWSAIGNLSLDKMIFSRCILVPVEAKRALCGLALRHIHRTWPTKQISLHFVATFHPQDFQLI